MPQRSIFLQKCFETPHSRANHMYARRQFPVPNHPLERTLEVADALTFTLPCPHYNQKYSIIQNRRTNTSLFVIPHQKQQQYIHQMVLRENLGTTLLSNKSYRMYSYVSLFSSMRLVRVYHQRNGISCATWIFFVLCPI